MSAPRLEIDLQKISYNAKTLVDRLSSHGIKVTGVTKATLGSPEVAEALINAGVSALGDSRIENIERMRGAGINAPITLIRSPMLSQVEQVVMYADISLNTELDVINALSNAAQKAGQTHGIVLMVELGDLREGIMPEDVEGAVGKILKLPNIKFTGIGTNLACRSGVVPNAKNMAELSSLADSIDAAFGFKMSIVSGGNSGNLQWALNNADTGRINNLRLGESILLGLDPLTRKPLDRLYTDAIKLISEVIEAKIKPSQPQGKIAQTAFGYTAANIDQGNISQAIVALGEQTLTQTG